MTNVVPLNALPDAELLATLKRMAAVLSALAVGTPEAEARMGEVNKKIANLEQRLCQSQST